ncbi:alkaline-phosphatase-like protein [Neohortaea acidophila]|uniref:Alkaline-phosphatase-like protein n=1 Tax=Neohortaea acidophila TaxID=245834 RepID=A0A6A6PX33_9PEZI|nr:alkaline-phosphatase-like protein [Neohortaea acidophila]KAF2484043.1 alkaline-phosphatase-like protein [Neohortaea acidophila]
MGKHKNILLMIADDMGKNMTCYGARNPHTPHLDRLAASGTRFDAAFTSTASCSCSRSVIYTGLHTHENGQWGLAYGKQHFQCFDHIESAPKLFNDAGYLTGIIGKVHVGPDHLFPWTVRQENNRNGEEATSRDTALVADRASAFFERARAEDVPFFLTIGYIDPHRHAWERGGFGNREGYDPRIKDVKYDPNDVELPPWTTDVPEARREFAEFYRSINRLDQGVGLMLDALKRNGFEDDTLVIFLSDNGPPFVNSKTTLYDAGVCLPLLIRAPGQEAGIANPNLISYIDLLPTMLDWAGTSTLPLSSPRKGRSMLPILTAGTTHPAWPHVFGSHTLHEITNYWPTRFLRTHKFKYHRNLRPESPFSFASDLYVSYTWEGIRNSAGGDGDKILLGKRKLRDYLYRPAEELYDLERDPDEVRNLAGQAAYADVLIEMRKRLEVWQLETRDPFLLRDGVSLLAVKRYVEHGEKIDLPDRFDMPADRPGNKGVRAVQWTDDGLGVSSGFWSSA